MRERAVRLVFDQQDKHEYATLAWLDWFNNRRLLERLGYTAQAEYEGSTNRACQSRSMAG